MLQKDCYILAISGGVDSVVLLDKIMRRLNDSVSYVIAHYDHGIRIDSARDEQFVEMLAKKYDLPFESEYGDLGENASEALAREKRYDFLRRVKAKHNAEKIVTAHHQDDVIETMVINILRGTGPRGLMPMVAPSDILRPLISQTKQQLILYANEHKLSWVEDSTNDNEEYLRNYVRKNISPKLGSATDELLAIRRRIGDIYLEVDGLLQYKLPDNNTVSRNFIVMLPFVVLREWTKAWLMQIGVTEIDRDLIDRLSVMMKTLPIHKKVDIDGQFWLHSESQNLQIIKKVDEPTV